MYKVMVVDDEKWILENLKTAIEWTKYEFELVDTACNGIDALEKIQILKPDAVFTDIRMPGMNGLELIKNVNDLGIIVHFVVISGYAEFAYAQKAMNYGTIGYCLKPIDEMEIVKALKKIKESLDAAKNIYSASLLQYLEDKSESGKNKLNILLGKSGFVLNAKNPIHILVSIGGLINIKDSIRHICIKIGNNKMMYIIQCNQNELLDDELIAVNDSEVLNIGASGPIHAVKDISSGVREASIAAYQYFIRGVKGLYRYDNQSHFLNTEYITNLENAIKSKDLFMAKRLLKSIEQLLSEGNYSIREALRLFNSTMSLINKCDEYIENYEQLAESFAGIHDMIKYLEDSLESTVRIDINFESQDERNQTFMTILDFIKNNYNKHITIQSISAECNINANYLSQLFKKEMGMTLVKYITKLRIMYACNLLDSTNLSINEISEKCGYDDYFYFIRIFKKVTDTTPNQYREAKNENIKIFDGLK